MFSQKEQFWGSFTTRGNHTLNDTLKTAIITPGTLSRLQAGQLRNCGLISGRGKKLFFSLKCLEWFWGPSSLPFNRYWDSFTGE